MQRTPDPEIKAATRRLITASGGLDAAASAAGVARSTMAEYQAVHLPTHMPADIVAVLEQFSGDIAVTQLLASRAGYALVALRPASASDITRRMADLWREAAELGAAHAEALADGSIDAAERERIGREAADVARVATDIAAACRA